MARASSVHAGVTPATTSATMQDEGGGHGERRIPSGPARREKARSASVCRGGVAGPVRDLVDVEHEGDEQGHGQRGEHRLPAPPAGAGEVSPHRHDGAEAERGHGLAEAAMHEPERGRRVRQAQHDAHGTDAEQTPAALGGEEQAEADRHGVERRRSRSPWPGVSRARTGARENRR